MIDVNWRNRAGDVEGSVVRAGGGREGRWCLHLALEACVQFEPLFLINNECI